MTIFLIIFGAVFTAGLGIWQKIEADDAQKKADKFNEELINSQKELIKSQKEASENSEKQNAEILRLSEALTDKTTELLSESEKARKIQLETIEFINGHKFPELFLLPVSFGVSRPMFLNNKKNPIYDMSIIAYDFDALTKTRHVIQGDEILYVADELAALRQVFGPYFVTGGTSQSIDFKFPPMNKRMHFGFEVVSRAGLSLFYCVAEGPGTKLKYCYRVYELDSNNKQQLVSATEQGLSIKEENYWMTHFHTNKSRRIGAVVEKP